MQSLEQAYSHCRRIARVRARNFFLSFAVLPRPKRDSMCAIYAFMRKADDLADEPGIAIEDRYTGMLEWRRDLRAHLAGIAGTDPVLTALADAVRRHAIPHEYFYQLLDGMESDLEEQAFTTFEDLYDYCYRAASVVGLITIHVFGFRSAAALSLAERCGIAFQLTNILRDIGADAAMGRVYLPDDELEDFGFSRPDVLAGTLSAREDRFQALMRFQWSRADRYYREAEPLLELTESSCRPALWAMIATYRGILDEILRVRFDTLGRHVGLPLRTKLSIALRALLLRVTGGVPSLPA